MERSPVPRRPYRALMDSLLLQANLNHCRVGQDILVGSMRFGRGGGRICSRRPTVSRASAIVVDRVDQGNDRFTSTRYAMLPGFPHRIGKPLHLRVAAYASPTDHSTSCVISILQREVARVGLSPGRHKGRELREKWASSLSFVPVCVYGVHM